jgi:replicative DNA helicase
METNDRNFSRTTKIAAYSIEAEQAVLGSILINPECFSSVSMLIRPDYFYLPQNKAIFTVMQQLDATSGKIDLLMALEILRNDELFNGDDNAKEYLFKLTETVPAVSNVESYCNIIRDKYYVRTLINASSEIITLAEESGEEADVLLDQAEQKIYDIRRGRTVSGPEKLSEVITDVYDTLYKLNSEESYLYKGLPTGFPDFDRMCTGLNRSDLVIIGARPAMGKTSFCLNMARNVAVKTKKKVVFFSLEMGKEQLAQRIVSTEARIPSQKMRTGDLTPKEWEDLSAACLFLADVPLYFDDTSNITVSEMKARIRRLKDVGAVFIDYLQLMKSDKRTENRATEVADITRNLKLMAKDLQIPVVVCAQLTRGTEERGKSHKPQLSDLRESGSIEQDADIVAMLYRESYYKDDKEKVEEENVNTAQLLVQKNRHGPTGPIQLAWNAQFTLYTCVEKNQNNDQ